MIKQGILNADLRSLTARIGHRDRFAIVDAGYNIPLGIETVDLAFLPNIPSMVQVVEGIINEMAIEEVILACEIKEMSPDLDKEYAKHWPEKAKLSYIPHIEFDEEIKKVKAVIRTGGYKSRWLMPAACISRTIVATRLISIRFTRTSGGLVAQSAL